MKLPTVTTILAGTLMLAGCGSKTGSNAPSTAATAQTMAFKAAPSIVAKARVGESAAFDLRLSGTGGEITDIRAR
jgi:uncharacterized lipoprotein YajG